MQVRVVERTLAAACNWGEEVAQCWATVSSWLQAKDSRPSVKVPFFRVQQLVTVDPVPCEEPCLALLKVSGQFLTYLSSCYFQILQIFQTSMLHLMVCYWNDPVLRDLSVSTGFFRNCTVHATANCQLVVNSTPSPGTSALIAHCLLCKSFFGSLSLTLTLFWL
jgi:hypothetical protein